jgi:hypothetical protein
LPLALELAAARLRLLSPEALLERLDRALDLLTSGPRDIAERHRTLRATIDWSHALLTEPEQRLFRRMAVFAGGCTLVDVEAVCAEPGESCLDELESLVDKALVQPDGDRLRLLQTIGEYARERLDAAGETSVIAERHARRYAQLTCEIRDGIEGSDEIGALGRGIADEGNIQAALDTLLTAAKNGDAFACETGLQMCGDLFFYWHIRGKNLTAREYTTAFLDSGAGHGATVGRAAALITAGLASWILGQFDRADEEWAEAYRIASELGCDRELCVSAFSRALSLLSVDIEAGLRWTGESIERSRALGFHWAEGLALAFDGLLHGLQGDVEMRGRGTPRRSRSSSDSETRRERAYRSEASRSWLRWRAISRAPSTSTGSRSLRSRPAVTGWKRRGSSPRWPGRTSGTRDPRSRGAASSTRFRPTTMWRAFVESASR